MNILETIADANRALVAQAQQATPLAELQRRCAEEAPRGDGARFEAALAKEGISFICEVKRASPSKGLIAANFPYVEIARSYEAAGADAISCLTEPQWFKGSCTIFAEIREAVPKVPMLRKDFIIDEYQIYEARCLGADAVLLICSLLDEATLARYLALAEELSMTALVEAHDADEVERAVACGARIIGVNNRNLKDFTVDFGNSIRLRRLVPPSVLFVTESGVKSATDIALLHDNGVNAVLVGETLMRAGDKAGMLAELRSGAATPTPVETEEEATQ